MNLKEMLSACIFVHIGYHLFSSDRVIVLDLVRHCHIQIVLWGANVVATSF